MSLTSFACLCPHRLAWPRTPAFQAGNTGSNPVGDTTHNGAVLSHIFERGQGVRQKGQVTSRSGDAVPLPVTLLHSFAAFRSAFQTIQLLLRSPSAMAVGASQFE